MKLLLVDDEPGIRDGLAALLRRKGHTVLTAGDCARATALVAGQDLDLVITDWRLPDGRASTFVGRCACPVVAMSGHPEEVASAAISAVLTKPVPPQHLLELLVRLEARGSPPPVAGSTPAPSRMRCQPGHRIREGPMTCR